MQMRAFFNSALVFTPRSSSHEDGYTDSFRVMVEAVKRLSVQTGKECRVLLQHSLKEDKMGIMVECGKRTIGGVGETLTLAVLNLLDNINEFRRDHAPRQTKERSPGTQGGRRRRGKGAAR